MYAYRTVPKPVMSTGTRSINSKVSYGGINPCEMLEHHLDFDCATLSSTPLVN